MSILVSDSAAEESLQAYTSPLSLQAKALDDLSERVLNGDIVNDGNNVFTFLTEFSANMTADIVTKACDCFNSLYPENAQTATELYKHLSDFDYIGLYATPSTTTVGLTFNRNFLIDQAVKVDTDSEEFNQDSRLVSGAYSKIVLPAYSRFTVGDLVFGLMYPVEIRVRKAFKTVNDTTVIDYDNSTITVVWDTSYQNPLMSLSSHILEHRDYIQDGVMLTEIEIPIYQFEVENNLENAVAATGFSKRYDFKDKFYAVRVFHFKNGQWNELNQTFSDTNYDIDTPTAIVKVLMDIGKVEVTIPHIYFNSVDSSTVIGNRILVKIYTTKGEVNIDLSEYQTDQFTASFLLTDTTLVEEDKYSSMLKRIPIIYVIPLSTRISSGTNGITLQGLKNRVKYNNSYTVKITPSDLENYFRTSGFTFTKEIDNITDRVYCAHKTITDGTGSPVASGEGIINISSDMLNSDTALDYQKSITILDEDTFTIHPSALYKYNEESNDFTLLKDSEKNNLLTDRLADKVNEFNTNLYTYSPFHVVVSKISSTPITSVYDLYNPTLRSINLVWENEALPAGMSIYDTKLKVLEEDDKAVGYDLRVAIYTTNNLANVLPIEDHTRKNIIVLLTTETSDGLLSQLIGEYAGIENGRHVFSFKLTSDYAIDDGGNLKLNSFAHELGKDFDTFVPIKAHPYTISFFISDDKLEEMAEFDLTSAKSGSAAFAIPAELERYTMLTRQMFTMKLGDVLPLLQGNITISTTDADYETYGTTQFATYQASIYERWTVDDVTAGLCTVDKVGSLKYPLVVKHAVGDVIVSSPYIDVHNQVCTLTVGDELIENLELTTPTQTSSPSNTWNSVNGSIYVVSQDKPDYTGVYKLDVKEGEAPPEGYNRSWTHTYKKIGEKFDNSVIKLLKTIHAPDADVLEDSEFYSSNSRIVIQEYEKAINALREIGETPFVKINTEAKGYDRKYFLIDVAEAENDPNRISFDFKTYKGFLIEYSPAVESDFGHEDGWCLNYRDQVIDPETGITSSVTILIAKFEIKEVIDPTTNEKQYVQNVIKIVKTEPIYIPTQDTQAVEGKVYYRYDSVTDTYIETVFTPGCYEEDTDPLKKVELNVISSDVCDILKNDPVKTSVIEYETHMCYTGLDGDMQLIMYQTNSDDPVFTAKCYDGNDSVVPRLDPWKVVWGSTDSNGVPPSVTRLTKNYSNHRLSHMCAGKFIFNQVTNGETFESSNGTNVVGQKDISKLYRRVIIEYSVTQDLAPVSGKTYYKKIDNTYVEDVWSLDAYESKAWIDDEIPEKIFVAAYDMQHRDGRSQYSCNKDLYKNEQMENGESVLKYGVGTDEYNGAIYYRDYDASNFDYASYGLDINHVLQIFSTWENNKAMIEESRYEKVAADLQNEYHVSVAFDVLRKIVSDTQPCYYFPWKKVVNLYASSTFIIDALYKYLKSLDTDEYAGYVSILKSNDTIHYFNFPEDNSGELSINAESSTWLKVDHWPWEYNTPWICLNAILEEDNPGQQRKDLKIIYNSQMSCAKVEHATSDLVLDNGGAVIRQDGKRKLIYGINTIQCDYKLRLSEDASYIHYLDDIRELIRAYLLELKAITPSLLARTKLYFSPIRTFGNDDFKGSSGESRVLPVQCSMELGLHIESYVSNSVTKKQIIRDEIINLILKDVKDGTINMSELAKTIMSELNDDIVCADVLGINGDKTLQTLIPVHEDCYPQLKQILTIHDDGTIHMDHDLILDWYVIN